MPSSFDALADEKILWLTTTGAKTGLLRPIEIWFVVHGERFYLFAENGEAANWVKNIRRNRAVKIRVGDRETQATARVLDAAADRALWDQVAAMADRKYGWGDGLPVEINPTEQPTADSDLTRRPDGRANNAGAA
jgi:deazaflavin-dependent oxidoreductase (nitroreductase family)